MRCVGSDSSRRRAFALPGLILGVAALSLAGCDRLVPAIGPSGDVTILTDLPSGHPAEQALRAVLERPTVLVRPEPSFRVESLQGSQLGRLRHWRNLVLMVDLSRPDPLTGVVEGLVDDQLLTDMRAGRRFRVFYPDLWASGQTVLILAGADADALARAIVANGDELFASFERRVVQQIADILYLTGDQQDFSRYLESSYGWTIRIPKGYRVSEDAEERVVRLWMPEGGARLVFVYWEDGVERLPDAETCLDTRARIVWTYDEDTIVRERSRWERADFVGGRALKLHGVWQNDRYTKGGPFRTYCFMVGDRFYMIDLLVFEPEGGKIDLMRQVEAIAQTFRDTRA